MGKKMIVAVCALILTFSSINAQNVWESLLKGVTQGTAQVLEVQTIKKVLNNPSLQSADMKNYLKLYNMGETYVAQGDYANAAESYCGAYNIASISRDNILKTVWTKYGWAADTRSKVEASCANAGIPNPFNAAENYQSTETYNSGMSSSYSSGGSSSSSTNTSRVCSLCNGTGLKIKEHYSAGQTKFCNICNTTKGTGHMHVRCDLCNGTGRLNY